MKPCEKKQRTIKVCEGNEFALLLPLKRRTYVSNVPIDEDIDCTKLQNVTLTIGGVEYPVELGMDGVRVHVERLDKGTYDIILTATYEEAQIRAAYFEALIVVDWNYQSDAEQYLPGSPITADAAIIIGGPLTDEELSELKTQYIAATAAAEQAEAEAQAAKEAWEQKAEQLDDVAKQGSNPNATNTAILEAFGNIDFSTLAKEQTLTNALQSVLTELYPKATSDQLTAAKQAILDALAQIQPEDPNSKALAQFFGVTEVQGYEFMTDTEVTDEIEDIMGNLDTDLGETVEYPEGSGTYMTLAQAITAEAMEIINTQNS